MASNAFIAQSAWEHQKALQKKKYSAKELALACLEQAKRHQNLGIFIRQIDETNVIKQAEASDTRRAKERVLGPLDGIPVSIKDNIAQKGFRLSCASRMLEKYVSPYDATVIKKLQEAGAVLFGQTNMDEFAMGSSTENSAFQKTHNPWNADCVPGGSSGGAAASVAACTTPLALGSDTGGSIRQPASFCGVVGMRPTYGLVSRYGLVAFASSMDQIGPLARDPRDCALLLSVISGRDPLDTTSPPQAEKNIVPQTIEALSPQKLSQLRVGLMLPEKSGIHKDIVNRIKGLADYFTSCKAKVIPLETKLEENIIPIYYILATAEASSNLSRYDGVRYGKRIGNPSNIEKLYIRSRTEGFGVEVRRRILLGTFVLSTGYYDAYYKKAQLARRMIQQEYNSFFKRVDVILSPTSPVTAFGMDERKDPLAMYRSDLFTIPSALAGLPSLNIPLGLDHKGLPIGVQFTVPPFADKHLLEIATTCTEAFSDSRLDYKCFTA